MKNLYFWLQLFFSAAIPTALGTTLVWVFTQFQERLPNWSYNLMLSFVYVVYLVVFIVLIVSLIRLAFGDWFVKLRKWHEHRSYDKRRLKISEDWCDKWIDLSQLLLRVSENDWRVSDDEQDKYSNLRNWFRLNRSKFLPIWDVFKHNREPVAHERSSSSASLMHKVFYESHEDPFSYFYSLVTIREFNGILPSYYKDDIPLVLLRLKEQLEELMEWLKLE